jgi:hypothetical protein
LSTRHIRDSAGRPCSARWLVAVARRAQSFADLVELLVKVSDGAAYARAPGGVCAVGRSALTENRQDELELLCARFEALAFKVAAQRAGIEGPVRVRVGDRARGSVVVSGAWRLVG